MHGAERSVLHRVGERRGTVAPAEVDHILVLVLCPLAVFVERPALAIVEKVAVEIDVLRKFRHGQVAAVRRQRGAQAHSKGQGKAQRGDRRVEQHHPPCAALVEALDAAALPSQLLAVHIAAVAAVVAHKLHDGNAEARAVEPDGGGALERLAVAEPLAVRPRHGDAHAPLAGGRAEAREQQRLKEEQQSPADQSADDVLPPGNGCVVAVQQHILHKGDRKPHEREVDAAGKVAPPRVRLGNVPLLRRHVRLKAVEVVLRP